jgi:hypothetical protein
MTMRATARTTHRRTGAVRTGPVRTGLRTDSARSDTVSPAGPGAALTVATNPAGASTETFSATEKANELVLSKRPSARSTLVTRSVTVSGDSGSSSYGCGGYRDSPGYDAAVRGARSGGHVLCP